MRQTILIFISVVLWAINTHGQDNVDRKVDTTRNAIVSLGYIDYVSAKTASINNKLNKESIKLLNNWKKREARIIRKLQKADSSKSIELAANSRKQFDNLQNRLNNIGPGETYISSLDTLGSSLKFLKQNPQLVSSSKQVTERLHSALNNTNRLQSKFQQAEELKKFIAERKQLLKEKLLGLGFAKQLRKFNKQAYYFNQQVKEYQLLLTDHSKAKRKALNALGKTKLFKDFMRKNSQLASLFRLPTDDDGSANSMLLAGLQTRVQVNSFIQSQIASSGPNALSQVQQNIQDAQSKLNELKSKIMNSGGTSSNDNIVEGFKPNNQKTKRFLRRLEIGSNVQSQKSRGYFSSTSDIGLSIGYKVNDKSTVGMGVSYKLGLGKDIRHVKISHQGIGLRSFVDWKIKGSVWLTGGYEMNYRAEFKSIQQLKGLNSWQQSGLIGLSKLVSLKTKFLKQTKLQLYWDFLSYRQAPRTQAVLFRIGYNF